MEIKLQMSSVPHNYSTTLCTNNTRNEQFFEHIFRQKSNKPTTTKKYKEWEPNSHYSVIWLKYLRQDDSYENVKTMVNRQKLGKQVKPMVANNVCHRQKKGLITKINLRIDTLIAWESIPQYKIYSCLFG
jgi:hypothetical protein